MTLLGPQNLDDPVLRHLSRDIVPLSQDQTVGQALAALRSQHIGEKIVYFYVVDGDGRLVGVVPTRRLLMSEPDARITDIMVDRVAAIPASATVLDACEYFILHRFLAFPVVDDERRLLGTVEVSLFTDEVLGMAEKRSAESAFQIIGVHVALGRKASPWASFKDRFPWLLCNMTGGIACATLIWAYTHVLEAGVVLAMFIPVVLALSESVSIQSMTITLQSLHQERVNWRLLARSLAREFLVAALLGAVSGLVVGGICWIWGGRLIVAVAIVTSILLGMITACLLGVAVPGAVRAMRRDPQIAAGPVVLAAADVASLLFYFSLAGLVLR